MELSQKLNEVFGVNCFDDTIYSSSFIATSHVFFTQSGEILGTMLCCASHTEDWANLKDHPIDGKFRGIRLC